MWQSIIMIMYLTVLSASDIKEKRVPAWLLVIGAIYAGGIALYWSITGFKTWQMMILGIVPGLALTILSWLTGKAGYADGIILMIIGVLNGYRVGVFVLGMGLFLACVVSVVLLLFHKVQRHTKIPYIPYMEAAFLLKEVLLL